MLGGESRFKHFVELYGCRLITLSCFISLLPSRVYYSSYVVNAFISEKRGSSVICSSRAFGLQKRTSSGEVSGSATEAYQ